MKYINLIAEKLFQRGFSTHAITELNLITVLNSSEVEVGANLNEMFDLDDLFDHMDFTLRPTSDKNVNVFLTEN